MKFIRNALVVTSLATLIAIGLAFTNTPTFTSLAQVASGSAQAGAEAARGANQPAALFGDSSVISTVTNTLLFLAGALAVIMIIVGGLRYATSGGKAASVSAAKNTVMYALVGLIIAFLAFALVNWILDVLSPGSTSGFTHV